VEREETYGKGKHDIPAVRRHDTHTGQERYFEYAARVDEYRWNLLERAGRILADAGVTVVLIIPPVAPTVVRGMDATGQYGILDDLRRRIAAGTFAGFDFHDPAGIRSGDCEFLDGFHGGEVTTMRMLQHMAADPRSGVTAFVDPTKPGEAIRRFSGHAVAYAVPRSGDRSRRETDFLGLGCQK
jgi:hypothetical protein